MEALSIFLRLLTPAERSRLHRVLLAAVVSGVLQTLAVLSVLPFMALVADPEQVREHPVAAWASVALGLETSRELLFVGGAAVLLLVTAANLAGTLSLRMIHLTTGNIVHSLSTRLLSAYLHRPYEWFLSRHSSGLNRNLLDEARAVVQGALLPLLHTAVQGVTAVLLVVVLLVVDVRITLVTGVVLGGAYLLIYLAVRFLQDRFGELRVQANQVRFHVAGEALGGIKEVKSLGVEDEFIRRFHATGPDFVRATSWSRVVAEVPRYVLEVLAIGTVLVILLYLLASGQPLMETLPTLAVFAFAGYKLVPVFNVVFNGLSASRYHVPALRELEEDLLQDVAPDVRTATAPSLRLERTLELADVGFHYEGDGAPVLRGIDLRIERGERIGVVGPTGSGKTTLVDLLLGLLPVREGEMRVDGRLLEDGDRAAWRGTVGYVPQSIFLSDDTVEGNIAFGDPPEARDRERIERVARLAEVHDFVSQLPEGYRTPLGERGVRLSGGQRQRVGIARALYRQPSLLLLDEATSALDSATEEAVMDALFGLERHLSMVMVAHRLSTVRRCDRIVVLEGGRVEAVGGWDELLATSELFRILARGEGGAPADAVAP